VVCGTAGPGVAPLFNGLTDARKEGAPIIAIAGDVETSVIDASGLEELNPYQFFDTAALYIGRVVRLLRNSKCEHTVRARPDVERFQRMLTPSFMPKSNVMGQLEDGSDVSDSGW
jgi:Thiamine pyrophosphate enzyme, N-terminal TPP binding domain